MTARKASWRARRGALAGYLIVTLVVTSVANGFALGIDELTPGVLAWIAGAVLLPDLDRRQQRQAAWLFGIGTMLLVGSHSLGVPITPAHLFTINQPILAMLAGVSFVRIIARSGVHGTETLPVGRRALARTMLGTALIGAAINVSAMVIVGDRIGRNGTLSRLQALALSRAFAATALWSPFFASIAVALQYAPGASVSVIMSVGLPLFAIAMLCAYTELALEPESRAFPGYPLHREALALPLALAAAVLLSHQRLPAVPILSLTTALAAGIAVLVCSVQRGPGAAAVLHGFVRRELPRMGGELVLFIAAGVFAIGVGAAAQSVSLTLPFDRFGPAQAVAVVASTGVLGAIGLHPLISVATWSALLAPLAPDPELLALAFVMSWSLGVSVSPLSGLHLFMQGRFGVPAHAFARWNARLGLVLALVYAGALYAYARFSG